MNFLILGIGNEIKRDDAVGLIVAREVYSKLEDKKSVDLKEASAGGIPLLGKIKGYDKVFVIDSVITESGEPGDWYFLPLENIKGGSARVASHSIGLKTMKKLGEELGESMPEIQVYAIEVKEILKFSKSLTKEVREALPRIISGILESIKEEIYSDSD